MLSKDLKKRSRILETSIALDCHPQNKTTVSKQIIPKKAIRGACRSFMYLFARRGQCKSASLVKFSEL